MKKMLILVLSVIAFSRGTTLGHAETIEILEFGKYKAEQNTPESCWAACLQMMLNESGVEWNQTNIVESIRGKLDWSGAKVEEITKFLNGWKSETPGQPAAFAPGQRIWAAGCEFIKSTDPRLKDPNYMPRLLANQRPLITCIRNEDGTKHAVVVFKVDYKPQPGMGPIPAGVGVIKRQRWVRTTLYPSIQLNTLTYFDPYDGSEVTEDFDKLLSKIEGYWSAFATAGPDITFPRNRF